MNIQIVSPGDMARLGQADPDLLLVDVRNYGGYYVSKNKYGSKNFILPVDYLGLFITQPNLVPAPFTLLLPSSTASVPNNPVVESAPTMAELKSAAETPSRPPI